METKILDEMRNEIDKEMFICYNFDPDNYIWVIGVNKFNKLKVELASDYATSTNKNMTTILGVDVKVDYNHPDLIRLMTKRRYNLHNFLGKEGAIMPPYITTDSTNYTGFFRNVYSGDCTRAKLVIKNVIFNDPATIVFWEDGSKTIVKAEGEPFDPEKGLAMAIAKKSLGNKGNYYNEFKKWLPKETKPETTYHFCEECIHVKEPISKGVCVECIEHADKCHWEPKKK